MNDIDEVEVDVEDEGIREEDVLDGVEFDGDGDDISDLETSDLEFDPDPSDNIEWSD